MTFDLIGSSPGFWTSKSGGTYPPDLEVRKPESRYWLYIPPSNFSQRTLISGCIQSFGLNHARFSQKVVAARSFRRPLPKDDAMPIVQAKQFLRDDSENIDKSR